MIHPQDNPEGLGEAEILSILACFKYLQTNNIAPEFMPNGHHWGTIMSGENKLRRRLETLRSTAKVNKLNKGDQ